MWPHPKTLHRASAAARTAYTPACASAEQRTAAAGALPHQDTLYITGPPTVGCPTDTAPHQLPGTPRSRVRELVLLPAWHAGTGSQGAGHRGHHPQRSCPSYQAVQRGVDELSLLTRIQPASLCPVRTMQPSCLAQMSAASCCTPHEHCMARGCQLLLLLPAMLPAGRPPPSWTAHRNCAGTQGRQHQRVGSVVTAMPGSRWGNHAGIRQTNAGTQCVSHTGAVCQLSYRWLSCHCMHGGCSWRPSAWAAADASAPEASPSGCATDRHTSDCRCITADIVCST